MLKPTRDSEGPAVLVHTAGGPCRRGSVSYRKHRGNVATDPNGFLKKNQIILTEMGQDCFPMSPFPSLHCQLWLQNSFTVIACPLEHCRHIWGNSHMVSSFTSSLPQRHRSWAVTGLTDTSRCMCWKSLPRWDGTESSKKNTSACKSHKYALLTPNQLYPPISPHLGSNSANSHMHSTWREVRRYGRSRGRRQWSNRLLLKYINIAELKKKTC